MDALNVGQFDLISNAFSFAIAVMGAATIFLFLGRSQVAPQYKTAVTISGIVTLIAFYHYWRILESFEAAYSVSNGIVTATGIAFNDAYRYVDWLLTVPLLLVELVLVLNLNKGSTGPMLRNLVIAAVLMIGLGYPGEISSDLATRNLWGVLSTIPFIYILVVLWGQLGAQLSSASESVRTLFINTRYLLIATWGFYPIAYAIGTWGGLQSANAIVSVQVGYTIADITAKCLYGVMIFAIAYQKSKEDGSLPSQIEEKQLAR